MRLQLDPEDDEAERKLKDRVERDLTDKLDRSLRGWDSELIPPGSTPESLAPLAGGNLPPTPARVRDALERALIDSVDLGTSVAFAQIETVAMGMDYTLVNAAARNWARNYAGELIRGIEQTTQTSVKEAVSRWIDNGEPLTALRRDLTTTFGRTRAEAIAATEVTRAYYEGNQRVWRETGLVEEQEWRTTQDERVCPTCGPLHETRVKLGETWPGGLTPPAHVRCRCWAVPVISTKVEPEAPQEPVVADGPELRRRLQKIKDEEAQAVSGVEERRKAIQAEDDRLQEEISRHLKTFNDPKWSSHEEFQAETDRLASLQKEVRKGYAPLYDERKAIQETFKPRYREAIRADNPANVKFTWTRPSDVKSATKRVETGVQGFNDLVDQRVIDKAGSKTARVFHDAKSGRSYFDLDRDYISMSGKQIDPDTVVHELGHWLEHHSDDVSQKSLEFYARRTKGEIAQWLGSGYDKSEIGRKDKFLSNYMGREYGPAGRGQHKATEIVSMGLEYLYRKPLELAEQDPDYFDTMIRIIRGLD